jgi:hypothetical protein
MDELDAAGGVTSEVTPIGELEEGDANKASLGLGAVEACDAVPGVPPMAVAKEEAPLEADSNG